MASDIILSNAEGKNVTLRNPDTNMEDIIIDGSDIAKNSDLVSGLATKADVISANDSQVKTALNASGSAPIYACRAWVNFNGTGTVAIRASGNVSSITDNGVGRYTVNFTTAMPDVNYSTVFGQRNVGDGLGNWLSEYGDPGTQGGKTLTSLNIVSYNSSGSLADNTTNNIVIFR